uniref:Secreted protein n=1 Tax=Anabas testudineus TaxID=64144 RepID=A0A3Q1IEH7_ANATE
MYFFSLCFLCCSLASFHHSLGVNSSFNNAAHHPAGLSLSPGSSCPRVYSPDGKRHGDMVSEVVMNKTLGTTWMSEHTDICCHL